MIDNLAVGRPDLLLPHMIGEVLQEGVLLDRQLLAAHGIRDVKDVRISLLAKDLEIVEHNLFIRQKSRQDVRRPK